LPGKDWRGECRKRHVENSLALHAARLAAKRPAELQPFDEGGNGFGVRASAALPVSNCPRLISAFAARKGVFAP